VQFDGCLVAGHRASTMMEVWILGSFARFAL
jgi:hypothetical protein